MADEAKAKGNAAFSAGKFADAITHFSDAINLSPTNHVLYSNRSAAHASLGQYSDALTDAKKTVEIKPDWSKGYSRLGSAHLGLRNYKEAVESYKKGLDFDPNNEALKSGLSDAEAALPRPDRKPSGSPFGDAFGPEMWTKLTSDPKTRGFMQQPDFVNMMKDLQRNPNNLNMYLQDPRVMQSLGVLLNINIQTTTPEEMDVGDAQTERKRPAEEKKEEPVKVKETKKEAEKEEFSEEEREIRERKAEAQKEKEAGNAAYKKKDFDTAIQHYSKAIELDDADISFITNRAAVYLEMGKVAAKMSSHNSTWDQIDRSESYLVSCMYEEAVSSSASILKQLLKEECNEIEIVEFNDMLESAAMVFVQSLNELGRTSEILKELKMLFGSVSVMPIQVFLTGACFQMQEGPYDVRESLEEFLGMWECVDDEHYILASTEKNIGNMVGYGSPALLEVDKYLEVVEVYVVTLLAVLQKDVNFAISWVEKAALPEQKRQELLRRLNSMYASKATSLSQGNLLKDQDAHAGSVRVLDDANRRSIGNDAAKETLMKLSNQRVPGISWFRNITLRFGNAQLVISSKSILLGCLLLLTYYFMRRKQADLKRVLKRQALNVKKAVTDLWQLAFSYQVNPLAAVQPLPPASHGSR